MKKNLTPIDYSLIDTGILPALKILRAFGFDTFESCEGGKGHAFPDPTIKFWGDEFDCIRAYELCEQFGLNVFRARRIFFKEVLYSQDNTISCPTWVTPYNEIVFLKHCKTGTIYLPGQAFRNVHT